MYSTQWCGYCRRAREWLDSEGIRYVDRDIEADERARERAHDLNPRRSVPTFEIDETVIVGFSAGSLSRAIDDAARAHL
jgi:glutaredoxin